MWKQLYCHLSRVVIGLGVAPAKMPGAVVTDVMLVAAKVYQHLAVRMLIFHPDCEHSHVFLCESCISVLFLAITLLMIMSNRAAGSKSCHWSLWQSFIYCWLEFEFNKRVWLTQIWGVWGAVMEILGRRVFAWLSWAMIFCTDIHGSTVFHFMISTYNEVPVY